MAKKVKKTVKTVTEVPVEVSIRELPEQQLNTELDLAIRSLESIFSESLQQSFSNCIAKHKTQISKKITKMVE